MKKVSSALVLLVAFAGLLLCASTPAQEKIANSSPSVATNKGAAESPAASPADHARAALAAHGGDSFRNLKSLILKGSGLAFSPLSTQAAPIDFTIVYAGTRVRIDMKAPFGMIHLINDGEQFFTLFAGQRGTFGLAPPNQFGLNVLADYDKQGATITALPLNKDEVGFRIADADGRATDFYMNPSTGLISHYEYKYNNYVNSWEQKDYKKVEGVLIPHKLVMKLGSRVGDYYAEFKVKVVQINPNVSDSVFSPPVVPPAIESQ